MHIQLATFDSMIQFNSIRNIFNIQRGFYSIQFNHQFNSIQFKSIQNAWRTENNRHYEWRDENCANGHSRFNTAGADFMTDKMLHEYRQLGLRFTYDIDETPKFCPKNQIVSSFVILESVASTIFMAFKNGKIVNSQSIELKDFIDDVCKMGTTGDDTLGWMSRCVSRAIITGIQSTRFNFVNFVWTNWNGIKF